MIPLIRIHPSVIFYVNSINAVCCKCIICVPLFCIIIIKHIFPCTCCITIMFSLLTFLLRPKTLRGRPFHLISRRGFMSELFILLSSVKNQIIFFQAIVLCFLTFCKCKYEPESEYRSHKDFNFSVKIKIILFKIIDGP